MHLRLVTVGNLCRHLWEDGHVAVLTAQLLEGWGGEDSHLYYSGRGSWRIVFGTEALERMTLDISLVQEVKITDKKHTAKQWASYGMRTVVTGTSDSGGITLMVRENKAFTYTMEKREGGWAQCHFL